MNNKQLNKFQIALLENGGRINFDPHSENHVIGLYKNPDDGVCTLYAYKAKSSAEPGEAYFNTEDDGWRAKDYKERIERLN